MPSAFAHHEVLVAPAKAPLAGEEVENVQKKSGVASSCVVEREFEKEAALRLDTRDAGNDAGAEARVLFAQTARARHRE